MSEPTSNGAAGGLLAPMEYEDMQRREVPVRIGSRHYILLEAMAGDIINYKNLVARSTRVDPKRGSAVVEGYADAEIYLLGLCLQEVVDGKRRRVPGDYIRTWRNEIQQDLWERLQRLSGMTEDDTVEGLLEQRADIDARLRALGYDPEVDPDRQDQERRSGVEEHRKNSLDATTAGSV